MTSRGGEVITRLLAALFREAPEQLLVDVTHLQPGELVRAKREFLVLIEDRREPVVLHHHTDGGAVIEVLDDVVNVFGKAVDVFAEVFLQQRVVFLIDTAERPVSLVGERALFWVEFEFLDQLGEVLRLVREIGAFGEHLDALGLAPSQQHALQPPDDDDRQDYALVFVCLKLAAQALGGFPDVTGKVVELGFVKGERHGVIIQPRRADAPFSE